MKSMVHRRGYGAALRYVDRLSRGGLIGAVVFYCLSLTPSLIPRIWLYQAAITGFSVATGYGIGAGIEAIGRRWGIRFKAEEQTRRTIVMVGLVLSAVAIGGFTVAGAQWQEQLRVIFNMEDQGSHRYIMTSLLAMIIAVSTLALFRVIRRLARWVAHKLSNFIPPTIAKVTSAGLVAVLLVLTVNGVIIDNLLHVIRSSSEIADRSVEADVKQPWQPQRSGSPESPVRWDQLRRQGRAFVSGGPTLSELEASSATLGLNSPAIEPIRVYAGLNSKDLEGLRSDVEAELIFQRLADQVVAELDRTDAWSREVLVVATTTGTGWVDPAAADTLEYMYGGNTAIAAMQYSFMPSWVSFVSDRTSPVTAGRILYETVYAAWREQPEEARPRIIAFGISLGSYGSQGAFASVQDVQQRTDGALWVGTPNFTELWGNLTDRRDPGSPEASPVLDGGSTVRWGTTFDPTSNLWDLNGPWDEPRIAYLQHPSDAVTWWSFDLLFNRPDWLNEPRETGVLPQMHWMPVVTFLQVTMDMFAAGNVPGGNGHMYVLEYTDGWAAVAPPEGWTPAQTEALRSIIEERFGLEPELTPGSPGFGN